MRKIRYFIIKKKYRYGFISLFIMAIAILLFFTVNELTHPKETKMDRSVYHYTIKPIANYDVTLKPNTLYEGDTIGEGKFYFTELVDTIHANFNYEYNGDTDCNITGEYEILGVLEGYIINSDKINITIWEKPFILKPNTSFNSNDGKLSLSKEISIKLEDYNAITNEIVDITKTTAQFKLILRMNVNLKAETAHGVIDEQSFPSLTIPLYTNLFEISKDGVDEKEEDIIETVAVTVPVNKTAVIICGLFIVAFTISLLFLIIFVLDEIEDPLEKKVKKIFKDHGSRFVTLVSGLNRETVKCIFSVRDINDLVKIADELEKPIFYEEKENLKEIKTFYLIYDDTMYVYDIKEPIDTSNEKNEELTKNHENKIGIAG